MLSGLLEGNALCIQLLWIFFALCEHSVTCRAMFFILYIKINHTDSIPVKGFIALIDKGDKCQALHLQSAAFLPSNNF